MQLTLRASRSWFCSLLAPRAAPRARLGLQHHLRPEVTIMNRSGRYPTMLLVLATSACFHQVVRTGRPAGQTVVDKPWVNTWLWGLVAAQPLEVRQDCRSGIATIETETSFVNGLVGALTLGIYTPQHVRVTCATGSASLPANAIRVTVSALSSPMERQQQIDSAIEQAIEQGRPVVVHF